MKLALRPNRLQKECRHLVSALFCLLVTFSLFSANYLRLPSSHDSEAIGFASVTPPYCHSNSGSFDTSDDKSHSRKSEWCSYCSPTERIITEIIPIFENYYTLNIPIYFVKIITQYSQSILLDILKLGILTSWSANSPPQFNEAHGAL
jgi:hypothetical protein